MIRTIIEIERRGGLSPVKKKELLKWLNKNGKLLGEYNQLSIFIESESPYIGDIENTKVSIAVAIQKNLLNGKIKCSLKSKSGKMQSQARKETIIPFKLKDLDQILNFLEIFEIKTGSPRFYHRWDYKTDNYFVSIKEKGYAPDHFEVETVVDETSKVDSEEKKMTKWLSGLGLTPYTQKQYKEIMLGTFRKYPPVEFEKIDFNKGIK